jgi:membrane protease YdiL (CAAX protease family)
MSFVSAAVWSVCAIAGFDFLYALVMVSTGSSGALDLVSGVLCEAASFVATLFFLTLVHERERPLSRVLGLRAAPFSLMLIAALFGVALQGPINLMTAVIYERYPFPREHSDLLNQLFHVPALHQKIALVLAAGVVGPVVEELLFRGGIFGGLRRRESVGRTIVAIAIFFALAHREPRNFLPDFAGGLAMGYVRYASGSIWPAILMHAAFNTTSVIFAFLVGPEANLMTTSQNYVASAICAVLLAAFWKIAMRSERSAAARAADTTGQGEEDLLA